jgi:hypothetical protein
MLHVFCVCGSEGYTSPMYLLRQSLHTFVKCGFVSRVYFCMLCVCWYF